MVWEYRSMRGRLKKKWAQKWKYFRKSPRLKSYLKPWFRLGMSDGLSLFQSAHPVTIANNTPSSEADLTEASLRVAASLIQKCRPFQVIANDMKDQQNAEIVGSSLNNTDFSTFAFDDSGDTYKVFDRLTGEDITSKFIKMITEPKE
jgi:hypothetical protein